MTEREKISDFVQRNGITLTHEDESFNPHTDGPENMDNYKCVLRRGRKRLTVHFSKGIGLNGEPPTAEEVLDCLASDAAGFVNSRGFEDWYSDYGYSEYSCKAERTYRTIERQERKLRAFLGDAECEALLWNTERG